jgi:FkbM family methyltransferase
MEMNDAIETVGDFWVLKHDNAISEEARKAGTITYDKTLAEMPELLNMPKLSWVFDVGAFIGDTTRTFLDMGFIVTAFEPMPDAFECLQHNCPDAQNLNYPLGDGRIVCLDDAAGGNMGGRQVKAFRPKQQQVRTIRLDELKDPAILKIDVEGFEPAVLAGASQMLESGKVKRVLIEFNPQALAKFGWTCEHILCYFDGWDRREYFRYYEENWDVVFSRP